MEDEDVSDNWEEAADSGVSHSVSLATILAPLAC